MANPLVRWFHHLRQRLRGAPRPPAVQRPPDARVDASPWLKQLLDELGARYRLGEDKPEGSQIVRRTGKERFNPMRVYVRASDAHVAGDYDVRVRDWVVDSGRFTIFVGGPSAGPLQSAPVRVEAERPYPPLSRESMLKDFSEHPRTKAGYRQQLDALIALFSGTADAAADTPEQRKARDMAEAFLSELPVWKLPAMSQGKFSEKDLEDLLARVR